MAAESVWRRELGGFLASTPLWLDRFPGRPPRPDAERLVREVAITAAPALSALGDRHNLALSTIFSAAWGFLIGRLTGERDVVFGAALHASQPILPVRVSVAMDVTFLDWMRVLQQKYELLRAFEDLSLDRIQQWSALPREQPLFESLLAFDGFPASDLNEVAEPVGLRPPLVMSVLTSAGGLLVRLDAEATRFDDWTIARTLEHFHTVLASIAAVPEQRLGDVSLVDEHERRRLLMDGSHTAVEYRNDACIHELFAEQAALQPDAAAVLHGETKLTYRELDLQSNQLAHYLRDRGVGPDVRVALCLDRTPEMIVALLGILKAGGGYLPLDPAAPRERLAFMLADAGVPFVLTQASLADRIPAHDGETLMWEDEAERIRHQSEDAPRAVVRADQLAYVNYTSGSTGTPKGVEILHRSVNRLVCAVDYVRLGPDQTLLHAAPLSFDASTFEIWGALLNGGRCALYPDVIVTPEGLAQAVQRHRVTTMWLTAALFNAVVDQDVTTLRGVEQLVIGGEALSVRHVRHALDALPAVQIINGYGPTEATTFSACHPIPRPLDATARSIPIGRPIRDTRLYVLDEQARLVPVGVVGELYIGGAGLARGYLNRPELTAEKFVADPFAEGRHARLYRTGDRARYLPDGTLDFVGRTDNLVKIRGFRIELGEIEVALAHHPSIRQTLVVADEDARGGKRIVAYVVSQEGSEKPTTSALREYLQDRLPDYMVPSAFVWLPALPISPNGKVDRSALPAPDRRRPELGTAFIAPRSSTERLLCKLFRDLLSVDHVGIADGFFELGGNSLVCLELLARLRRDHGLEIPVVDFFRAPTPEGLGQYLLRGSAPVRQRPGLERLGCGSSARADRSLDAAVAIVGMAGRFPGAASVDEMWRNLCAGVESVTFWSDSELDPAVPDALRKNPSYVRGRGVLRDVDMFDAEFFGVNPREAEVMDPQQRIFLEVAWEALEHAGYVAERYPGLVGIYGGMNDSSYFTAHVAPRPDLIERVGAFQAMVGHEKDYLTTRVAHRLGLTGPALNVQTACSTSLVAVSEAFFSLRAHRCDMALAGGVAVMCPPRSGYLYQEGAMLSSDGHTRPFDADARGTVFSDGVAIVVLKRLEDALADGDTISAVIRGAAVNSDGAGRASFSAPSVDGQAAVIAMAHACAEVDPRTISYVEAHGTATPLGDPIEVEALTRAFRLRTEDIGFCALGSVKSNMGHLVMAAGAAGLIKTALALAHGQIPPTLHFRDGNPRIDFKGSPFFVNAVLQEWPRGDAPRRAGVSSFGVGGTNAHVVLEEAPNVEASGGGRADQLLVLSARTPSALETATTNLATHLRDSPAVRLADVAFTLQTGRRDFPHRRVLVAADTVAAAQELEARDPRHVITRHLESRAPGVVLMFPGQGSQYANMGFSLYREDSTFRAAIDECAEALIQHLGLDLRQTLYQSESEHSALDSSATAFVQPALFVTEYALARLWMHWGVEPQALIGHSVGEFVCGVLAGVFSLEDALRLVAIRGRLMQELPGGAMLSVRLSAQALAERLEPELAIASSNGPSLSVASGPVEKISALQAHLEADGVSCRLLRTSHAFHSPMMDPVVEPFARIVADVTLRAPEIPVLSTVTGTWLTPEQATDPMYWAHHLRKTVRFADGVQELWKDTDRLLLEVGPGSTLVTLARQQAIDKSRQFAVATLGDGPGAEWPGLLKAVGQLWLADVKLDWQALHGSQRRRRVPLPTYPFERKCFWIDAPRADSKTADTEPTVQRSEIVTQTTAGAAQNSIESLPLVQVPFAVMPESSLRKPRLVRELQDLLENTVGVELDGADLSATFMELGLDSLTLTQTARQLQKTFGINVTFRQLMEEYPNLDSLAEYLDQQLPPETPKPGVPMPKSTAKDATAPDAPPASSVQAAYANLPLGPAVPAASIQHVIDQQLRVMAQQLALLSGGSAPTREDTAALAPPEPAAATATSSSAPLAPSAPAGPEEPVIARATYDVKKAFGAIARIHLTTAEELAPKPRARLQALVRRYTARTEESKRLTQVNRPHLADPRAVSGFRPILKELIYPITIERSKGSRLWDVDGNEYVDVLCGFGAGFFGWQPDFVTDAVKLQIDRGLEIGPQHPLAGEVARSICEITEFDRAGFCNTGSEAVMGAMRIARTVTGRDTIAIFSGSYHGIFDEVIVRGTKKLHTVPAAPGIMASACQNVLVLDYGTPESLEILRARAGELAAIMVEPVQSRRPDFQPRDYLMELRRITDESGALYIFDEMITGFRVHPRGAQGHFGIRADLATYGKLIGGGYPIGVIAGRRQYMDALDGGAWQFGDDSMPTVGVTYFAGTFVRHPLALAAAKAVLDHLREQGPGLQLEMNEKTERMATELNAYFVGVGAPLEVRHFGSMWKPFYLEEQPFGDLLFVYLRDRGLHILDGFPCFLNTAHSDADVAFVIRAFKEAVAEMQEAGFLPERAARPDQPLSSDASAPPVPGARLGRDPDGTPAWYVPHPDHAGQFVKLGSG